MTPETVNVGWLVFGACIGFLGACLLGFIRSEVAETLEVQRLKRANSDLRNQVATVIEDNIGLVGQVAELEFAAVKPQLDDLFGDTSPMVELAAEVHWLSTVRDDNVVPLQRRAVD